MDYFNTVFTTFLSLEHGSSLAVYAKLLVFIKNILICVLKMNKGLTGFERHEGE